MEPEIKRGREAGKQWPWAAAAIFGVAAALRFYDLALVPLHHDEGVNGRFLIKLLRDGIYRYDPANYHGPTLYYFACVAAVLRTHLWGEVGLNAVVIRFVPAAFGTATVWLVLKLRRHLGDYGALGAAALVALSPGMIYFSRCFIHESLFVFFTLAIVVAGLGHHRTVRPVYLMLASASAALLFATKETAFISVAVLLLAWFLTLACFGAVAAWEKPSFDRRSRGKPEKPSPSLASLVYRVARGKNAIFILGAAAALFVAIYVAFYSSFGRNFPQGVYDSVAAFHYWTQTSASAHTHDAWAYATWLRREEWPLLWLGVVGGVFAVRRGNNRFAFFCALWAAGIMVAYSILPYKTPWLAVNLILPLALTGGYAVEEICAAARRSLHPWMRVAWVLPVAVLLVILSFPAIELNFYRYDDNSLPYVYAHTVRDFLRLIPQIEAIAARNGTGTDTEIMVVAPNYWPLPWYVRNYPRAAFWGRVAPTSDPIVIGQDFQESQMQAVLGDAYARVGYYELRPDIVLVLYARRGLLP
jgi:uncharacterized protein (TIGR03663 family)